MLAGNYLHRLRFSPRDSLDRKGKPMVAAEQGKQGILHNGNEYLPHTGKQHTGSLKVSDWLKYYSNTRSELFYYRREFNQDPKDIIDLDDKAAGRSLMPARSIISRHISYFTCACTFRGDLYPVALACDLYPFLSSACRYMYSLSLACGLCPLPLLNGYAHNVHSYPPNSRFTCPWVRM